MAQFIHEAEIDAEDVLAAQLVGELQSTTVHIFVFLQRFLRAALRSYLFQAQFNDGFDGTCDDALLVTALNQPCFQQLSPTSGLLFALGLERLATLSSVVLEICMPGLSTWEDPDEFSDRFEFYLFVFSLGSELLLLIRTFVHEFEDEPVSEETVGVSETNQP